MMELQTSSEHREAVLNKIDHYLACVVENIQLQPESEEKEAFEKIMKDIHLFAQILNKTKGKDEFVQASHYLSEVLHKEFFQKLYSTN